MTRFGTDYHVARPTGRCAATGQPLEPGVACIAFGEESIEDICMQFHQKAPWVLPTGVREEVEEGQTRLVISLTSDDESMDISIDTETMLMQSLDLEITGGFLVQAGATMRYHHEFEYMIHNNGRSIVDEAPGKAA